MTEATLPKNIIEKDHNLDAAVEKSQMELAKLRWHWTLDESNPDRVIVSRYAKDVGRATTTISVMVNGYAAWLASAVRGAPNSAEDLASEIEVAKVGAKKQRAAKSIAKHTGRSAGNVARHNRAEVKALVSDAEDAVERKAQRGEHTTYEEEVDRLASTQAKTEKMRESHRKQKAERHTLRFMEMEGHFAAAKRRLTDALNMSPDIPFDDGEVELLRETIGNLSILLNLIDMKLGGAANVDWDAEMAKLDAS